MSRKTKNTVFLLQVLSLCFFIGCGNPPVNDNPGKNEPANDRPYQKEELLRIKNIQYFFDAYEINFNKALAGEYMGFENNVQKSFTDCFVETDATGVTCGQNDSVFLPRIKKGLCIYRSKGTESMVIRSKKIDLIDDYHAMVKVNWRYTAIPKNKSGVTIDFDVFYFVKTEKDTVKIFAWIAGDEQVS